MNKIITIIFDTETTGLLLPSCSEGAFQPRITEVGAIKLENENHVDDFSQLINPNIPISKKITKLTGIDDEKVKDCPTFTEVFPRLKEFFSGADVLICHNASFDIGMLNSEIKRCNLEDQNFIIPENIICTALEYQHIFGGYVKLKDMYKHFLGKELAQTHRALDDCHAVYDILKTGCLTEILGALNER